MTNTTAEPEPTVDGLQAEITRLNERLQLMEEKAGAFWLSMACENCDTDMYEGLTLTLDRHRGYPVIPFDIAAQTVFRCARCGASSYTGDFDDVHVEGGSDVSDDDEADDDTEES